jgi:predicted outer membrane protein
MKKLLYYIPIILIIISCNQQNQETASDQSTEIMVGEQNRISSADIEDMIIHAMINSRLQTALAELAPEKCEDTRCSAFCEMINNNHYQFQYYIGLLAMTYDIELPQGLTPDAQAEFVRIQNLPPEEFDREFIKLVARKHQEDIERMERILTTEEEVMERGMIEEMYDTMKKHLEFADRIRDNLTS